MIVIEHNLDVISRADWVIDLGPGAGHDGGTIVFEGPPHALVEHDGSLTGRHLARRHIARTRMTRTSPVAPRASPARMCERHRGPPRL